MQSERRPEPFLNIAFTKIMQAGFEPEEKARLSAEAGGFMGEIGLKIAQLQAEGLGRTIGIPSQSASVTQGSYQEIMYALPLTSENVKGPEKQVLLVCPHDQGYDLAIVSPLKIIHYNLPKDDERLERRFDSIFSPSEDPYIFTHSWEAAQGERALKMFSDRRHLFSAVYQPVPQDVTYDEVLAKAIQEARTRQESKQREVVQLHELYNHGDPGHPKAA